MKYWIAIIGGALALFLIFYLTQPLTKNDCLLRFAATQKTQYAVSLAEDACEDRFGK